MKRGKEKKRINCILLIDDNADDNIYNQIIIEKMNMTDNIKVAENGIEALNYLEEDQKPPDLILLDINMPKMNGWEFLEIYRAYCAENKLSSNVVVLASSLSKEEEQRLDSISVIASHKIKPLTKSMLEEISGQYLQNNGSNEKPENVYAGKHDKLL
jgi:CheY-like chemotaxis protein